MGELDIFEATTLGDLPRLRALLASDAGLAKAFSADGFTALHLAAFFGQPESAELLGGADPNAVAKNPMKVAVINSAAASGRADLVKMVWRRGRSERSADGGLHRAACGRCPRQRGDGAGSARCRGQSSLSSDDGQSAAEKAGSGGGGVTETGREKRKIKFTKIRRHPPLH